MGRCSSGSTSHLRGHPGARSIRIIIKRWAANAGVEAQRPLNRKPLEGSEGRVRLPWRPNRDNPIIGSQIEFNGDRPPATVAPWPGTGCQDREDPQEVAPLH